MEKLMDGVELVILYIICVPIGFILGMLAGSTPSSEDDYYSFSQEKIPESNTQK